MINREIDRFLVSLRYPTPVMLRDASETGLTHYKAGIEGALQRTEAILRAQYDKATQKTRNMADYQEALWALADSTADRRQITEIYESSYARIAAKQAKARLARDTLNQRYLSLRKESHGRIVVGFVDLGRHNLTTGE